MRFVRLSFFVGLALGACDVPPEQAALDVCTAVCDCLETTTTQVEECVAECVVDIPPVSDDCLTCVYTNSQRCSDLLTDCEDVCTNQATPLLGGM